ncbi:DUF1405 domain-containing protein [Fervidibacillus albus]|uniref:DUF1405 domain-containing protein n=1 Tax=Fervidibacillus albus TaxID=2980026 RepID=A0A9E8LX84_9BACI|nr:DUF1405 domain-containing protein [Fervidibacillus albus]WAA11239.1 DUF1405 domain-containing protein [Fervidibacillus albus]
MHLHFLLTDRFFLFLLLIVNGIGTIYGYIWYGYQLAETPPIFLPFVPDSPTASLFFLFVLVAFIRKKNWPLMEALALITLFKYGVWAVVMNILTLIVSGNLPWEGYMLIASHFAMAVQGLLYAPYYRIKIKHLMIAGIWTLHNDVIDYIFFMYPRYSSLDEYVPQIGYFTFWLSVVSIGIAYYFGVRIQRKSLRSF